MLVEPYNSLAAQKWVHKPRQARADKPQNMSVFLIDIWQNKIYNIFQKEYIQTFSLYAYVS